MISKIINKQNSADWIRTAKDLGIDLANVLFQDKKGMYEALDKIGLPTPKRLFYPAVEYNKHKKEIEQFIKKYKPVYSRLNPFLGSGKRPFKININSLKDFLDYVEKAKAEIDLKDYELHIIHNGNMLYSGNIIYKDIVVGELLKGRHIDLAFGHKTPMTAMYDDLKRRFVFMGDNDYTAKEKQLLLDVIKMVGDHKGYFEFVVTDKGELYFKNFQKQGGFTNI
jgi:hypothetical protein